ncbi:MAG: DUF167 domain-containing protein [Candidatus Omnitrophica bacterium]|nr:DUF167 domain-containing protein [Candidatus Omnitrophota bacterium]
MRTISVKVQPRASVEKVLETGNGEYKVYTCKPAVDGQANKAVIEILSKYLEIKKNRIRIKTGHNSKNKVIEIYNG